jgi:hypothetical protein
MTIEHRILDFDCEKSVEKGRLDRASWALIEKSLVSSPDIRFPFIRKLALWRLMPFLSSASIGV